MKKLFTYAIMMAGIMWCSLMVASCSSDGEQSNSVVGGWEGESQTANGYNAKFIYNFYDDGTYKMQLTTKPEDDKNTIIIYHAGGTYILNGTSLTMTEKQGGINVPSLPQYSGEFTYIGTYTVNTNTSFVDGRLVLSSINFLHYYFGDGPGISYGGVS